MLSKGESMWERRVAEQTSAIKERGSALQDEIVSQKEAIVSIAQVVISYHRDSHRNSSVEQY